MHVDLYQKIICPHPSPTFHFRTTSKLVLVIVILLQGTAGLQITYIAQPPYTHKMSFLS